MKTQKGCVIVGKNQMEIRDGLPLPEAHEIVPLGALVKPVVWSPCTTDVHICKTGCAAFPYLLGKATGHECVGIVEVVGPDVKDIKVGDRVIVDPILPIWRSIEAQDGCYKWTCDDMYRGIDHPDRGGSFCEMYYVRDADMNLTKIPDNVTWEQAIMVPDMMNTPFSGVMELDVKFGDSVAVIGVGPVGLMAVKALSIRGAGKIFAVGSRKVCFERAVEYGATKCIDYHNENYWDEIIEANDGKPVDKVVVAGGGSNEINIGLHILKIGGTLVNLVALFEDDEVSFKSENWGYGYGEKTVKGVSVGGGRAWLGRMVELISQGRVDPSSLITHTFHGMDKLPDAIKLFQEHDRTLIKPIIYND